LENLLEHLQTRPDTVEFEDVINTIEKYYDYTPVKFSNGQQINPAGENENSCKIFAFSKLHSLSKEQTLYCFGKHYRSVLEDPTGNSHQNIRQFMLTGWDGVEFLQPALTAVK